MCPDVSPLGRATWGVRRAPDIGEEPLAADGVRCMQADAVYFAFMETSLL